MNPVERENRNLIPMELTTLLAVLSCMLTASAKADEPGMKTISQLLHPRTQKSMHLFVLTSLLVLIGMASHSGAAEFYVESTGRGNNAGKSDQAFATFTRAQPIEFIPRREGQENKSTLIPGEKADPPVGSVVSLFTSRNQRMNNRRILPAWANAFLLPAGAFAQFSDPGVDSEALPTVSAGFEVNVFANEPLVIETEEGKVHSGVLIHESGLSLTLGLATAERFVIIKEGIENRKSSKKSAMPSFDRLLAPSQVADIAAFLLTQKAKLAEVQHPVVPKPVVPMPGEKGAEPEAVRPSVPANSKFALNLAADRLTVKYAEKPLAEYIFRDPRILRPYFANLHGPSGAKITRNHPPIAGKDAADHDTMHPGLWLGFGDISGVDFWRNHGRIQHVKFVTPPTATEDRVTFATKSELLTPDGKPMGAMVNRFVLSKRPAGWLIVWDATLTATERDLIFGDQEEMGFGARVATDLIETKGGTLLNSDGVKSARETWGKPAAWSDYSGTNEGHPIGMTLMPSPTNFRESWWHNRDYGVFVANPFGRAAMRQGSTSAVTVKQGQSLRLVFGAMLHDGQDHDPAGEYKHFLEAVK